MKGDYCNEKIKKIAILFISIILMSENCLAISSGLPSGLPPNAYVGLPNLGENTIKSLGDYSYNQIKGTYHWIEQCGGYYYAYSAMSNTYQSAYANILLPTSLNRANGKRNAYISLGITGSNHAIDLGICNRNGNWVPYYYEQGGEFVAESTTYAAPSTAKSAQITVKPIDTTTVQLYIQWQDANGNNVGTMYYKHITVFDGNLQMVNGKIKCKFFRFASLVPIGSDNQGDGSYMTGGMFRYCQLYTGSNYVSWGIGASTVEHCFLVSPSHISLAYSGQNDTFNIYHNG